MWDNLKPVTKRCCCIFSIKVAPFNKRIKNKSEIIKCSQRCTKSKRRRVSGEPKVQIWKICLFHTQQCGRNFERTFLFYSRNKPQMYFSHKTKALEKCMRIADLKSEEKETRLSFTLFIVLKQKRNVFFWWELRPFH